MLNRNQKKEVKMTGQNLTNKIWIFYFSISRYENEQACFTVGISRDLKRRSYEKGMRVVWDMNLQTTVKKEALVYEARVKAALKKVYDEAYVEFGAWDMEGYKQDRGWDWWYISEGQDGPLDLIKEVI